MLANRLHTTLSSMGYLAGIWVGYCSTAAFIDRDSCCLSLNIAPSLYGVAFLCIILGCASYGWVIWYLLTGSALWGFLLYVAATDSEPCLAIGLTFQFICIFLAATALIRRCYARYKRRRDGGDDASDGAGSDPIETFGADVLDIQNAFTPRGELGRTPRGGGGGMTPRGGMSSRDGLTPRTPGRYTPRDGSGRYNTARGGYGYGAPTHEGMEMADQYQYADGGGTWYPDSVPGAGMSQREILTARYHQGQGHGAPPNMYHHAAAMQQQQYVQQALEAQQAQAAAQAQAQQYGMAMETQRQLVAYQQQQQAQATYRVLQQQQQFAQQQQHQQQQMDMLGRQQQLESMQRFASGDSGQYVHGGLGTPHQQCAPRNSAASWPTDLSPIQASPNDVGLEMDDEDEDPASIWMGYAATPDDFGANRPPGGKRLSA